MSSTLLPYLFPPFIYTVKWTIHGSGPLPLFFNKITQLEFFLALFQRTVMEITSTQNFPRVNIAKGKKTQFRQDNTHSSVK